MEVDGVEYTAAKIKAMDEGEFEHLVSRAKMTVVDVEDEQLLVDLAHARKGAKAAAAEEGDSDA